MAKREGYYNVEVEPAFPHIGEATMTTVLEYATSIFPRVETR